MEERILRHLLTKGWQFERLSHVMIDTKRTRQSENRKKQISGRLQRSLTLMLGQH